MKKWFEIFRTGTHTALDGKVLTYTESDLDAIVSSYDPATHEAPMVVGHPKLNHPAFGWVKELKREGDKLLAYAEQIVPEFAEMVNQGLFKKRSIALNKDGTLRHIGFLGAAPPAVKGLADVQFSESDDSESLEFSADPLANGDDRSSTEDKPNETESMPPAKVDDRSSTEDTQTSVDDRSSTGNEQVIAALRSELAALKAERAQEQAATARAEFADFIDSQMREGRVVPKLKEPLMKMYDTILSTGMEFAEGSNPVQQLREVIQSMPKHLLFSETPAPANDPVKIDPTNLTQMAEMAINNS